MGRTIDITKKPSTIDTLRRDLEALGIQGAVLVHSSLSQVGWIVGGAVAMIEALTLALGREGTLVMPTHSADLSDPAGWVNPPVPESWWAIIRDAMPAFDPRHTPSWSVGRLPELFRTQAHVLRSGHPQVSFAARGPHASTITVSHDLDFGLGDGSPLARLYDLDGSILLLGVGHDRDTSLHLAEYRAEWPGKKTVMQGAPLLVDGRRSWVEFQDIVLCEDDFVRLGEDYERDGGPVRRGRVGSAPALLIPQRRLVDYAVGWMERNRR
ncbi:MAG: AAC(3) family N-acetyltransferase [Candidatus Eisenbacteria bacterium]